MKNVEVCLTPDLVDLYVAKGKVVVVIDILRATTCMTTAIANGVKSLIPVATLDECRALCKKGYIGAAERDGKTAEGFDLGNSPFSYMDKNLAGKTIAVTTTNGTQAILRSKDADEIIIGSFLNKTAVINYLNSQSKDVLLVCAGWKGKINLEDTLYAGAVIDGLDENFFFENDSAITAQTLYKFAKNNKRAFLENSSHVRRLNHLNIDKDIEFCLKDDVYNVIPVLRGNELVMMEMEEVEKTAVRRK
ncbi:MAG: 2-phosphosulfolactate phosphatase [Cytophagaceae bacterium]|nr:2-phosphosulfolactate phosphatase [Cytophagaceae bacterium]